MNVTFAPSARAILGQLGPAGADILGPILAAAKLIPHPDASCREHVQTQIPVGGQGSAYSGFQNMNDRCYNCRQSSSGADPSHHTCVSCGGKSCRTCFGAPANNTKGKDYVCNWCLRDYVAKNGSARLLRPVKGRMLCFLPSANCSVSIK